MGEYRQHFIVIGSLLLTFVLVFLVSSPKDMFVNTPSFIDTELSMSSGVPVRTKMDLGDEEHLQSFPRRIGEWTGFDHYTSGAKEQLGADVLFIRTYRKEKLFQPVFLLVMQSPSVSNFHQPIVCYPSLGYEIEDKGEDLVYVKDISWVERTGEIDVSKLPEKIRKEIESSPYSDIGYWVSAKKLVIFKKNGGEVTERRVILYFYIKDNIYSSNKISMLRVSALAPSSGSYNDSLNAVKELMGEAIPLLFELRQAGKMFITNIAEWGIGGYFVILLLLSIPLAMIVYPLVIARIRRRSEIE